MKYEFVGLEFYSFVKVEKLTDLIPQFGTKSVCNEVMTFELHFKETP